MHIGDISKQSGISPRMIRHYEKLGLIPPANRQRSGYRNYSEDDISRLRFIRSARDLGFPLAEIASLIDLWENPKRASREVKTLALARAAALQQQARELEEMRSRLLLLADICPGNSQPGCPILDEMAGVREPA
jgi:MerR family transcriptional regulator, copper efflux regulator